MISHENQIPDDSLTFALPRGERTNTTTVAHDLELKFLEGGQNYPFREKTGDALCGWPGARPESADNPHLFFYASVTGMTRRGFAKRLKVHAEAAEPAVPSIAGRAVTPHSSRHYPDIIPFTRIPAIVYSVHFRS